MDWSLLFSIFALVVSVASLVIANITKNIEKRRDSSESEMGKTALFSLTFRYFLINMQRIEFSGKEYKVKTDEYSISNYIEELELIASQFDVLTTTTYYSKLFKKFPMIGAMSVFIRKEIMFQKRSKSKGEKYGLDNDVWKKMFEAFDILKIEVPLESSEGSRAMDLEIYKIAKQINDSF
jgi:hypothetical protein